MATEQILDDQLTPEGSLMSLLRGDLEAFLALDRERPRSLGRVLDALTWPGFLAVALYRLGARADRRGWRPLARLSLLFNVIWFGCELHPRAVAGPGLSIPHPVGVAVGAGVRMGRDVKLFTGVVLGTAGITEPGRDGFPILGDGCMIYSGAKVFGPVTVGKDAIVSVNSVVMKPVAPGAIVAGSPARLVQYRPGYGPKASDPVVARETP